LQEVYYLTNHAGITMSKLFQSLFVAYVILWISGCVTSHEALGVTTRGDSPESSIINQKSNATLHAILVADTDNLGAEWLNIDRTNIGSEKDIDYVEKFLKQEVSAKSGLSIRTHRIEGKSFSSNQVFGIIDRLSIANQNDVILFYYTGHGVNHRGEGFPNLVLGQSVIEQPDFNQIISKIEQKGARLSILLADTCNNYTDKTSDVTKGIPPLKFGDEFYQKLFLNYYGTIVGVASKDDNVALASPDGGKFTEQLIASFTESSGNSKADWTTIKEKAETPIHGNVKGINVDQHPQIVLKITSRRENENILPLSIDIFPSRKLKLGENIKVQFKNISSKSGFLVAWDVDSHGLVSRVVPYYEKEIKLSAMESKISTSTAMEPLGTSYFIAVLVKDPVEFNKLKNLGNNPISRQHLENQLSGLNPTIIEYEITK